MKLRVDRNGPFEDIPRDGNTSVLGDRRNDENMMLSGLHAAFLLFHNNVVDRLRGQGVSPSVLFDQARQQVMWHYQWMIVHEYLPMIIGSAMVNDILDNGRRYYRPEPGPAFIPVEFQGAAFRFGHSQIRPSYRANLAGNPDGTAFFGMIFDPAGEGSVDPVDLRATVRAPRRFIDWQTFFNFNDGQVRQNKLIDRKISTPMFRLPLGAIASGDRPVSLPQRNLLRQLTWSMPAGQLIAQKMRAPVLQLHELAHYGLAFENQTPLWYYTLAEAEIVNGGRFLGPVGGRIVGEVFIGLMELDPRAYLAVNPDWRPTLPSRTAGQFTMVDLLTFAGVDPASRARQQ